MWLMQLCRLTEVPRSYGTSSRYREYGDYSPRFRLCIDWISPESMMEDIDQVVEPHGHVGSGAMSGA